MSVKHCNSQRTVRYRRLILRTRNGADNVQQVSDAYNIIQHFIRFMAPETTLYSCKDVSLKRNTRERKCTGLSCCHRAW
jgi:hypothetical protein